MSSPFCLPKTPSEWRQAAQLSKVTTSPIYSFSSPKSGSEVQKEQFLTLQVLFLPRLPVGDPDIMKTVLGTHHIDAAKNALDTNVEWQSYLKSIEYVYLLIFQLLCTFYSNQN